MTATELVEVVAEVLRVHGFTELEHGYWYCSCGYDLGVPIPDDLHAAHQARAVLAALTEAGKVQFGVRWHVGGCSGINRCTSKRHAERQAAKLIESGHEATVVSRLTFPWGRAE